LTTIRIISTTIIYIPEQAASSQN